MKRERLEAFSDGVLAIIITIMVLEIKVPTGAEFKDLQPLAPIFLSYVLSFVYLGIYWNNHHHLMKTVKHVTGGTLWANLNLLFWLSLIPFTTGWMGANDFAANPMGLYGVVLLMCAIAYSLLQNRIIRSQGKESLLAKAVGKDWKGKVSPFLYIAGIVCSWYSQVTAGILYVSVALLWLIPDRRIEQALKEDGV